MWGRGALDMKGGVAMMLAAFMRAKASGAQPPGDVILCLLADEEAGSPLGADFIVREHAELFDGVRYSIGEFGGFTMDVAGRRFYPIMVAEKQVCWTRATLRGPAGHGSMPIRGGAMGKLGRRAAQARPPPPARARDAGRALDGRGDRRRRAGDARRCRSKGLLVPALTDRLLDAFGERGRIFDPLLHNTVSATIVGGGEKVNVIPDTIELSLDGAPAAGLRPRAAVRRAARADAAWRWSSRSASTTPSPASPTWRCSTRSPARCASSTRRPKPIPMLLPGVTDGRFFSRLGIQTYGFLPMQLPPELPFMQLIHAENERLPADAVEFGTAAIERVLERF